MHSLKITLSVRSVKPAHIKAMFQPLKPRVITRFNFSFQNQSAWITVHLEALLAEGEEISIRLCHTCCVSEKRESSWTQRRFEPSGLVCSFKIKKKNGMSKVSVVKTAESLREKYLCLIFGKTDKKHTKI